MKKIFDFLTKTKMNTQNLSNAGTKIAKFIMIGLLLLVGYFLAIEVGKADTEYVSLAPAAQQTYESARHTLCAAEKALAGAKLMDIANGVKMESDLNELNSKRDMDCNDF